MKRRIIRFLAAAVTFGVIGIGIVIFELKFQIRFEERGRYHTIDIDDHAHSDFTDIYDVIHLSNDHRNDKRLCYGRLELVRVGDDKVSNLVYHEPSGKQIEYAVLPGEVFGSEAMGTEGMRVFQCSAEGGWVLIEFLSFTSRPRQ
jgi:hypothetical protein